MSKLRIIPSIGLLISLAYGPSGGRAEQSPLGADRATVAIPQFSASSPPAAETAVQVRQWLEDRLSQLEPYAVSDSSDVDTDISVNRTPDFSVWQSHRVRFLILAEVGIQHDGRTRIAARVWDVSKRPQFDGQQFVLQAADWPRAASALADEVVSDLTSSAPQ
jgi:Tol biopolymer transport system component